MAIITRKDMNWPATTANKANTNSGLVMHYDGNNRGLANKSCGSCKAYWEWCRDFHMGPGRDWQDVGYSYFVCPHGNRYNGREYGHEQAAQPGGNTTWTSCTLALGPAETPTDAQINGVRKLRAELMKKGMKAAIRGHSQFISTNCPGPIIRRMITDGTFREMADMPRALPVLREGSNSYDVKTARALMWARGKGNQKGTPEEIIGWLQTMEFTANFTEYVKEFQTAVKVKADGIIGPITWLKLERR